jgi:hypothetical protein
LVFSIKEEHGVREQSGEDNIWTSEGKKQEDRNKFLKSLIICTLRCYLLGCSKKEDDMVRTYSTNDGDEKCVILVRITKESTAWKTLNFLGKIILKLILNK